MYYFTFFLHSAIDIMHLRCVLLYVHFAIEQSLQRMLHNTFEKIFCNAHL